MYWLPDLAWDVHWVLFFLFTLVSFIQLVYFWFYFSRLAFYKATAKMGYTGGVSVVICAHNEYDNLKKNLPSVLLQDYHDFEVVVVDDASDDESAQFLQWMKIQYPHLKIVTLKENINFFKGKKLALSIGIKSARHEVVLLTDADCQPAGPHWLTRMVDNFQDKTDIVLGYGGFEPRPGLLNKLIRFDTLFVAMQYFSLALAGRAYMGVGRNLAYKRDLFFKAKGFTSHYKVMSGDDDLFINQVATRDNVAIEISPHSHTFSLTKTKFKSWLKQKRRHLTTGKYYKLQHKRMLGAFSLSHFFFYPLLAATIIFAGLSLVSLIAAGIFLFRLITIMLIYHYVLRSFNEKSLYPFAPFFDLAHPYINFIFVLASLFYTNQRWK